MPGVIITFSDDLAPEEAERILERLRSLGAENVHFHRTLGLATLELSSEAASQAEAMPGVEFVERQRSVRTYTEEGEAP